MISAPVVSYYDVAKKVYSRRQKGTKKKASPHALVNRRGCGALRYESFTTADGGLISRFLQQDRETCLMLGQLRKKK
jgi:hypothetical protein